jgi:nitrite reductase (NADH) small subunit
MSGVATDLRLADIPVGEARVAAVDGVEIALFRTRGGALHALNARCPHLGGPLADGLCDERVVVCPLHGHTFELHSGAEVDGELAVQTFRAEVLPDGTITVERRPAGVP